MLVFDELPGQGVPGFSLSAYSKAWMTHSIDFSHCWPAGYRINNVTLRDYKDCYKDQTDWKVVVDQWLPTDEWKLAVEQTFEYLLSEGFEVAWMLQSGTHNRAPYILQTTDDSGIYAIATAGVGCHITDSPSKDHSITHKESVTGTLLTTIRQELDFYQPLKGELTFGELYGAWDGAGTCVHGYAKELITERIDFSRCWPASYRIPLPFHIMPNPDFDEVHGDVFEWHIAADEWIEGDDWRQSVTATLEYLLAHGFDVAYMAHEEPWEPLPDAIEPRKTSYTYAIGTKNAGIHIADGPRRRPQSGDVQGVDPQALRAACEEVGFYQVMLDNGRIGEIAAYELWSEDREHMQQDDAPSIRMSEDVLGKVLVDIELFSNLMADGELQSIENLNTIAPGQLTVESLQRALATHHDKIIAYEELSVVREKIWGVYPLTYEEYGYPSYRVEVQTLMEQDPDSDIVFYFDVHYIDELRNWYITLYDMYAP